MKITFFFLVLLVFLTSCSKEQEYRKLKTDFSVGDTLMMVGEELDINNTSDSAAVSFNWDFGDGQSSVERNPIHAYVNPGLYTIKLKTVDISGNSDSVKQHIRVGERYIYELELLEIDDHRYFSPTEYWDEGSLGIDVLPDIYFEITDRHSKTSLYKTKTIYNVGQNNLPVTFQIPNIKISPFGYESGIGSCGIFLYDKDENDSEEMMSNWMSGTSGSNFVYDKISHKGEFTIGLVDKFKVRFLIK